MLAYLLTYLLALSLPYSLTYRLTLLPTRKTCSRSLVLSHTLTALVGKQRFERANLLRVRGGVRVRVRFDRESLLGVELGVGFRSGSGLGSGLGLGSG